jgi:broad specificity phosphatase PhoE
VPADLRYERTVTVLRYITHPEVAVDPAVPITRWGLSAAGRRRAEALLDQPWVRTITRVVSSDETKALETAELLAERVGVTVEVRPDSGENDRSATGFLPPAEFEAVADRFFARPHDSVRGWERAVDAQARITGALADLLDPGGLGAGSSSNSNSGDVAVVGHGGVGTLWWCALTDRPIDRRHDQPGQGHYFSVDLATRRVLHGWRRLEPVEEAPT